MDAQMQQMQMQQMMSSPAPPQGVPEGMPMSPGDMNPQQMGQPAEPIPS